MKKIHNEEMSYPCEVRESVFKYEYKLKIHIRDEHKAKDKLQPKTNKSSQNVKKI